MTNLQENMYSLMLEIVKKQPPRFSGMGIVVYDSKNFDNSCHCDLRPGTAVPNINVSETELARDYFIKISDYRSTYHDGFHMINEIGSITHIAQYFVPKLNKKFYPDSTHGVRMYSSICGSILPGVLFTAVISSNYDIEIFENGTAIINSKLHKI